METVTLLLFCASLIGCILLGQSVLYALIIGLAIFLTYGRLRGFGWKALLQMALSGVRTVKNILLIFFLIGMLTALWRAAGTVPAIIYYAAKLVRPSIFVLVTFLLNCAVSVLTGTSFGTAATMGVVCMTMAAAMGVEPVYVGGAVLSGAYFGDRCSPVSTSALLVSELTGTDIFSNIKRMCRTALVPFLLSCGIYALLGAVSGGKAQAPDVGRMFARQFDLSWVTLLPAAAILVLAALRVNVKKTMLVSMALAAVICLTLQGASLSQFPELLLFGYQTGDPELAAMLNGGGLRAMVYGGAIVCISSCYAGIFNETGLLRNAKALIGRAGRAITPYGGMVCTAAVAGMIACNQTLTIMLTYQLCGDTQPEREQLAVDLEDTAVVIAPLVPWSIAGAVPLATVEAPAASVFAACFLYILPVWRLLVQLLRKRMGKAKGAGGPEQSRPMLMWDS